MHSYNIYWFEDIVNFAEWYYYKEKQMNNKIASHWSAAFCRLWVVVSVGYIYGSIETKESGYVAWVDWWLTIARMYVDSCGGCACM